MKKKILLLFLLLSLSGCAAEPPLDILDIQQIKDEHSGGYTKISSKKAKHFIDFAVNNDLLKDKSLIIIDVRTASEYNSRHIVNAINIPNETINVNQPQLLPDLDAVILVYCQSGNRSAQAAKKLIDIGYQYVFDFGGIISWTYETE